MGVFREENAAALLFRNPLQQGKCSKKVRPGEIAGPFAERNLS